MNYELMTALKSEETVSLVKKLLDQAKVKVIKEEPMGKRRLAYEINKATEGFYQVWQVEGAASTVAEVSKLFKLETGILRFLFTKITKNK